MPTTKITTSTTTQIKAAGLPGKLLGIFISAPGTTWTIQVNDGPNPAGAVVPMLGATPFTIPAVATSFPSFPMDFSNGLQVVTAGATPGEIEVVWG